MSKKNILILIISVIVLALISLSLVKKDNKSWANNKITKKSLLSDDFDVNKVVSMTIKDSKNSVTLDKKDDKWVVAERNSYSADFGKIGSFILKLKNVKVVDFINAGKEQFGRLKLLESGKDAKEDQTAVSVVLKNASGKVIKEILLGKMHNTSSENSPFGGPMPDGRYVFVKGDAQPVLVGESLFGFSSKISDWLDKSFIDIKNVKSITVESDKKDFNWTLSREKEKDKFELKDIPKGKEVKPVEITSSSGTFNSFNFIDIYTGKLNPSNKKDFDKSIKVIVKTFDDFVYTINVGEFKDKDDNNKVKYLASVKVEAQIPDKRIASKDEKKEDKAKLDEDFKEKTEKLKDKLNKEKQFENWFFVMSDYKMKNLFKSKDKFLKKKQIKKTSKVKAKSKKKNNKKVLPKKTEVKKAKAKKVEEKNK